MKCKYCSGKMKELESSYYCYFCELEFNLDEVDRKVKRAIQLDQDSNFYQYMTTKDLAYLTVIELINYLRLARKEKRRIYDKIYSSKNESDEIDKKNFKHLEKMIKVLQNLLIEKQGFYPKKTFESVIEKEFNKVLNLQ